MKKFDHPKAIVRIFALGQLNQRLQPYINEPPTELDDRLLKGFYTRDKDELEKPVVTLSPKRM